MIERIRDFSEEEFENIRSNIDEFYTNAGVALKYYKVSNPVRYRTYLAVEPTEVIRGTLLSMEGEEKVLLNIDTGRIVQEPEIELFTCPEYLKKIPAAFKCLYEASHPRRLN